MPSIIIGISNSFCANFLRGQIDFLVRNGWEVIIISGPGEEVEQLARNENARLYQVNFAKPILPLADFMSLLRIIRIYRKEKPDIINAGNPKSGFLMMIACWLLRHRKRIFTLHGLVSDNRVGFMKAIMRATEKISCGIARKVIVVSPSLCEHAIEEKILAPSKAIVIEKGSCNGINLNVFSKHAEVTATASYMKAELGLADSDFVLGYVGRLSKDKGIDVLFEAFNTLAARFDDLRLLIVGPVETQDPFSSEYFHQLYHDKRIVYVGKVIDVVPYYLLMKLLVVSSFREGFGNVLIEAAAMEVPVIAPDIPGCRNALEPGINGLLFRKGSSPHLAERIERYLNDESLRLAHAKNGRSFAQQNFSQQKIWEGQLRIYEEMLQRR